MVKRSEQKARRREAILETALKLFVERGYQATTIADIAEAVPMSVGLLFHYFESKEILYQSLVELGLQGTRAPAAQKCNAAIDYFLEFAKGLLAFLAEKPQGAQMFVLMAAAQRNPATPESVRDLARQVDTIEAFVPIVIQGQKEGSIRPGNPEALSRTFWCAVQGLAEEYAYHPDMELPEADWLVDIVRNRADSASDTRIGDAEAPHARGGGRPASRPGREPESSACMPTDEAGPKTPNE